MSETKAFKNTNKRRGILSALIAFVRLIFRCPSDRKLIMIWKTKDEVHALGQTVSTTTVSIGRFKVASWVTYFTPISDWKSNQRADK